MAFPNWQPIDSAPRDGTWILVCHKDGYDNWGGPVAVSWRSYHPNAKGKQVFRTMEGHKIEHVTHWMPRPPKPETTPLSVEETQKLLGSDRPISLGKVPTDPIGTRMIASVCGLCGKPMPEGEEMFNYHGYSGPCPTAE